MADYTTRFRTNYFHVKPEMTSHYRSIMDLCHAEGTIELWDEVKDTNGTTLFAFSGEGPLRGILENQLNALKSNEPKADEDYEGDAHEEENLNLFFEELKRCVADDDAIILLTFNYVAGTATCITSQKIQFLSIDDLAVTEVRHMLNNKNWNTQMDY